MRVVWQAVTDRLGHRLARDIALVCLADGIVGLSFGAITTAAGLPVWLPMLLSVVVFAGASQFLFIAVITAGGSPIAAFAAGLLVNARHLPFGLAVGDAVGRGWLRSLVGSQILIDESTSFALAQTEPGKRRAAFWACSLTLFTCWNIGEVAGAFGGTAISDTDTFGLDAAFPAVLLALVVPSLKDRGIRFAAIVGSAVAVSLTFVLATGLPVLLSLAALPIVLAGSWRGRPRTADTPAHHGDQQGTVHDVEGRGRHRNGPRSEPDREPPRLRDNPARSGYDDEPGEFTTETTQP
jgi:4-azaleucine resistance transporter AzlC